MFITHRGYNIKKSKLTKDKINLIKNELTVEPFLGDFSNGDSENNNQDKSSFEVFKEKKESFVVPRYWGIEKFGPAKLKFTGEDRDFQFNIPLRDYQINITNIAHDEILKTGGGLIKVGCGRGKTIMSIFLAHKLKAFTLVVVHKTFLQDQWIERIKQVSNARIGIIRQDKVDIENKDIVIAMLQSISKKDYDIKLFDKFKFVIYDEGHHCASKMFSKALYKTGANYTLWLSATPDRQDKLTKVINWHLGSPIYQEHNKPNEQILTKIFKFNTNNKLFVEKCIYNRLKKDNTPHMPTMVNNLVEIKERNDLIINIINQLRKFPNRKILILSGRRNHLTFLKNTIDEQIKQDELNNLIEVDEFITCYYLGGMKEKDRKFAEQNADILFATYDMAHEGLDIDRLNTVILSTPKKNIIQSVGRVMRKVLQNGDIRPLIIDIADELSIFNSHNKIREKDYKSNKYIINTYYAENSTLLSQKDYLLKYKKFTEDDLKDIKNLEIIPPVLNNILDDNNDNHKVLINNKTKKENKNKLSNYLNILDKKELNYNEYLFDE